jgi:hypothetical protein
MNTRTILFIAFLLIFGGCKQNKSQETDDSGINIKVGSENYLDQVNYSSIFDKVEYVKLETTEESLIGSISKIMYAKNQFFILDKQQRALLVFSDTGKFLWKINKQGNGPGEYRTITDFDLNNDKLFLFDISSKVLEYDLSGNFVKDYPMRKYGQSIAVNDPFFYLYTCNQPTEEGKYQVLIMDDYGQGIKTGVSAIPKNQGYECLIYEPGGNIFYHFEDEIRFSEPFSTKIQSITKDNQCYTKYNIDFGELNTPENFDHQTHDIKTTSYAYGLKLLLESDAFFFFNIHIKDKILTGVYSKKENKLLLANRFHDNIAFCWPNILTTNGDFAVGFQFAIDLHIEYNFLKKEGKEKNTLMEKVVSEIDPDDNPVIFLYHFK